MFFGAKRGGDWLRYSSSRQKNRQNDLIFFEKGCIIIVGNFYINWQKREKRRCGVY